MSLVTRTSGRVLRSTDPHNHIIQSQCEVSNMSVGLPRNKMIKIDDFIRCVHKAQWIEMSKIAYPTNPFNKTEQSSSFSKTVLKTHLRTPFPRNSTIPISRSSLVSGATESVKESTVSLRRQHQPQQGHRQGTACWQFLERTEPCSMDRKCPCCHGKLECK